MKLKDLKDMEIFRASEIVRYVDTDGFPIEDTSFMANIDVVDIDKQSIGKGVLLVKLFVVGSILKDWRITPAKLTGPSGYVWITNMETVSSRKHRYTLMREPATTEEFEAMISENNCLVLKYIGDDDWSRPVYVDQYEALWKDDNLGNSKQPSLYSVTGNDFDGEPNVSMREEIPCVFENKKVRDKDKEHNYMLLDRLKGDCRYYLGNGNRNPNNLWADDEKSHIEAMKELWNGFSEAEKPEWLTWDQIIEFETQMIRPEAKTKKEPDVL